MLWGKDSVHCDYSQYVELYKKVKDKTWPSSNISMDGTEVHNWPTRQSLCGREDTHRLNSRNPQTMLYGLRVQYLETHSLGSFGY